MTELKLPITVLVQTKNEAVGIGACLLGLEDFDEVIVVDSNSTDETKKIAVAHGAAIASFTWNGSYPKKKQWQLDNLPTKHKWIFFMDADETPSVQLITSIRTLFKAGGQKDLASCDLQLDYVFAGRVLRHGHRVVKRALVHRDRVRFPIIDDLHAPGMGELEGHYQPESDGPIGALRGRLLHDDRDQIRSWFDRHNRYSDWEAHLNLNKRVKREIASKRTHKGRIFDSAPFKPLMFFGYSYIARLGFLDGRAGLDYALALSGYYWQIGVKTRELLRSELARPDLASKVTKKRI